MSRLLDIARAKQADGRVYRDLDTLFLVSHMRGFTSLLSHLLGSHPEVSGYFESHASYHEVTDLLKLRATLDATDGLSGNEKWIVDKLLNIELEISDAILAREDVSLLFMLREPRATLKSLIATRERYGWRLDRNEAETYYFTRLQQIAALARRAAGGYYLDAEAIVDDTGHALAQLSRALRLSTPLQPNFETRSMTAKLGLGCPSDYIKQGRIVREREHYDEIDIDAGLLARAQRAYRECRDILLEHSYPLALIDPEKGTRAES
jgi:hypothetical protein